LFSKSILLIGLFSVIISVYRQEAFKIFDKFYLVDMLTLFKRQLSSESCGMIEGPFCYQVANEKLLKESELLTETITKLSEDKNYDTSLENALSSLRSNLDKFKAKYKGNTSTQFKLAPKVMMNLLLNFESFDTQTTNRDVYMPEEKIVNFNVGYIKIAFKGKLRLTLDKTSTYENPPAKTFGVIEERDLTLKFDKPVFLRYLYLRPHKPVEKQSKYIVEVKGLKSEQSIFVITEPHMLSPKQWVKIVPPQKVIDTLVLPKGYDVDDISINHNSEFSEDIDNNEHLSNLIQNVIDEIMNKNNNKVNKDDF